MGREIERKFLVINQKYHQNSSWIYYKQGYLCTDKQRTVRIRIAGDKSFITIKGENQGISRLEYEYPVPMKDAEEMLEALCSKPVIEKHRYRYQFEGFIWEIDEFLGENAGLIIAEIELPDEKTEFIKPDWIGKEVSGDFRYSNSNLSKNPYSQWK